MSTNNNSFEALFAQYLAETQNPPAQPPAAPQNLTLDINGRPFVFSSETDASRVVGATIQEYEAKLAAAAQREQELMQAAAAAAAPAPLAAPTGQPKPRIDPEEWARMAVEDPAKATEAAFLKSEVYEKMQQQMAALQGQTVEQQFWAKHPVYQNKEAIQAIEGVRRQMGLGFNPAHLEVALSHAQMNGLIPPERDLIARQQAAQQAAWMAQYQAAQGGDPNLPPPMAAGNFQAPPPQPPPYGGGWPQQAQPPFYQPPPSPRGGSSGQGISTAQMYDSFEKMPLEEAKKFLNSIPQNQGGYR